MEKPILLLLSIYFMVNQQRRRLSLANGPSEDLLDGQKAPASNLLSSTADKAEYATQAGRSQGLLEKTNQDSFTIFSDPSLPFSVFCVCDGHGMRGEVVSQFGAQQFAQRVKTLLAAVPASQLTSLEYLGKLSKQLISLVEQIDEETNLLDINPYELVHSGSSLVAAIVLPEHVISVNLGDSRAVLFPAKGAPRELTVDHKPSDKAERKRIEAAGGYVGRSPQGESYYDHIDAPMRVWLPGRKEPGLAMSRVLGDKIVKAYGVSATPDVTVHEIPGFRGKLAVASDGIWDFIESKELAKMLEGKMSMAKIVKKARSRWKADTDGQVIDDITIVVVGVDVNVNDGAEWKNEL